MHTVSVMQATFWPLPLKTLRPLKLNPGPATE